MFTSRMLFVLFAVVVMLGLTAIIAYSPRSLIPAPNTPTPTVVKPTRTPTADEKGLALWYQVDQVWGTDWPQVLNLLIQLEALQGRTAKVAEKLYAAHVSYGESLLQSGYKVEAAGEFNNALAVNPDGGEAKQDLAGLTPAQ